MKGLVRDFHGWRGVHLWPSEPDLFNFRITLGFMTIWLCKFCVTDRLNQLAKMIGGQEEGR